MEIRTLKVENKHLDPKSQILNQQWLHLPPAAPSRGSGCIPNFYPDPYKIKHIVRVANVLATQV